MISEHEIETKDFDSALKSIIGKLDMAYGYDEAGVVKELAVDDILSQVIEELKIMDNTLHGKEENKND